MRKAISILLVVLCIAFSAFAGGSSENNGQIVIELWTHEDVNRQVLEDRYIAEFMEMNPNVTVNVTRQAATKITELVQTAFAAGAGPTIFSLSLSEGYPFIVAGRAAPMEYEEAGYANAQAVKDAYIDGMIDPITYNGDVYGLPLEITNCAIFINKRVFRDAGLDADVDYPKTWEEMVEVSEKLVIRDGDILVRRGFDFRYPYYLESLVPMVEQLGGYLISDDGTEAIIGEEAWIKVLTFMQEWGPNGRNLGSPTYTNARTLFNRDNNDIAMCTTGLYQEVRIKAENPEFYDSGDWMVVPFPLFEDAVNDVAFSYYGNFYMVNADADEATRKAAWALIGYMLSHGEEYLSEVQLIQPTKALMTSDTYNQMPYAEVFLNDFQRSHFAYYGAASSEFQAQLRNAVESVMLQGVSPEQAYRNLKANCQEILDEA